MLYLSHETPAFVEAAKRSMKGADYIICSHPYTFPLAREFAESPIIYESHNVEYSLKKQMLPSNVHSTKLAEKLFEVEGLACKESSFTTVCTNDDAEVMNELYGIDFRKIFEVPNGVDLETVHYTGPEERYKNKTRLGIENVALALFMGSWHQPNIEAVMRIFEFAKRLPDMIFLIIGSISLFFSGKPVPKNVGFMGVVDNVEKDCILSIVDVALNPMLTGSGTNMKMLDYLAAGVPVITTKIGARGLNIPEHLITLSEIDQFTDHLSKPIEHEFVWEARRFVEAYYSWSHIAEKFMNRIVSPDKRED